MLKIGQKPGGPLEGKTKNGQGKPVFLRESVPTVQSSLWRFLPPPWVSTELACMSVFGVYS